MSLRARLTIFYSSLFGGILLLFGLAIYASVRITLLAQVDETLIDTAQIIADSTDINSVGELSVILVPTIDLPTDVYYQLWTRDFRLLASSPNIASSQPIDPDAMGSNIPIFESITVNRTPFRVFTVPLVIAGSARVIGILQVGMTVNVIYETLRTLLTVLVSGTLLTISVAALVTWFSTNRTLAPLEAVTYTALQITRADDLSRRIPYNGPPDDEVGQLIHAFNNTLGRLENLFNTQRRFMADVGHELRTPLTVIKGNVGLMRRFGEADEESLSGIENEVDRLTRLVGDLLLLAQAESGKLPLHRKLIELDTLLLEALQEMRVLARDKLSLRIGDIDQVLVCADRDRIKQVLVNLIGNAINYTPSGGEVVLGVAKSENQARLTVTDNGPGIPSDDLPHIFERFYRGEKSRTRSRDGKGFGLGLSIAYWIVRNHGGRIDVDSTEGQGTTFCIWLPLLEGDCKQNE